MSRRQPTRLISFLALASACFLLGSCPRAEPQATPPAASTPKPAAAPLDSAAPEAARPPSPAPVSSVPSAESLAPSPPKAAPVRAPSSVLILGDSLADEAVGGGGFVRLLRQRCPTVRFDNRAKGGFMVNQMRKRLETQVLPEGNDYSHAIVFGGVNDLYSDKSANRTLARIESDLSYIYAALAQRGIDVIAVTVTPWGGFSKWFTPERGQNTLTLNAWILAQPAEGAIAQALDAYPLLSCGVATHLCPALSAPHKDGLHIGKLGHQKLGEALYELAFRGCSPSVAP
jgi:lysophospholipase L1-like esterase